MFCLKSTATLRTCTHAEKKKHYLSVELHCTYYYIDLSLKLMFSLKLNVKLLRDLFSLGGFYSDDVAYVGETCKKCPNGSFVAFDKAPGTQAQDCKSCPLGKKRNHVKEG